MRICLAIEKFDPKTGGAERYCWDLAHFLAEKGHEVAVICMKASDPENQGIAIHKIRVVKFPQALRHLSFAFSHFLKARKMKAWIHYAVGNTFYMDVYQPHGGLHAAWFERDSIRYPENIRPFIKLIKRISFKDAVQRYMEWWTLHITKPLIIAISKMVENDIRAFCGENPPEIILVPNGIDTGKYTHNKVSRRSEIRKSYGLNENDFVFLFVANNFILKGFRVLVEALERIKKTGVRLLVVGEPDKKSAELAERFGEMIVFAGKSAQLDYIYPACDCLVHPTYYDSFGLVVMEALSSGIPVITTDAAGVSMYLNEGTGVEIKPGDPSQLADAMAIVMGKGFRFCKPPVITQNQAAFLDIENILLKIAEHKIPAPPGRITC
jgi:UDP-glucose:(heptosyl)LPS alpha-1,3-glucosyltransferase